MIALFNLHPLEIVVAAVIAVLVFGRRLPEVAGQAAGTLQKIRRAIADLKRETGIDEELRAARRSIEEVIPRDSWRRTLDAPHQLARELERSVSEAGGMAPMPPPPRPWEPPQPPAAGPDKPEGAQEEPAPPPAAD